MCNMDCLNCKYAECINNSGATPQEIRDINISSKECKEYRTTKKHREYMQRYREEHKEELKEYMREYAKGNEVIKHYNKTYYQAHKDEYQRRDKARVLTPEQRQRKNEKAKAYKQRPEVKAHRLEYQRLYRARKKAEQLAV